MPLPNSITEVLQSLDDVDATSDALDRLTAEFHPENITPAQFAALQRDLRDLCKQQKQMTQSFRSFIQTATHWNRELIVQKFVVSALSVACVVLLILLVLK